MYSIVVEAVALSGFTLHNPNVVQIALLKNLNSIQGLTQRVMKPYMYSGATITYLGLSNDQKGLDDDDKEVCIQLNVNGIRCSKYFRNNGPYTDKYISA